MRPAVRLRNISKSFKIYPRQRERMIEAFTLGKISHSRDFWALRDINLDVQQGTTLGILGRNGAGKSTLLEIVAGILQPTTGTVEVNGQLVLLQIGAGINPEFTGRENVMMNGLILGIERKKMLERFDEIEEFADIGEFMDQPVKTYSTGMKARLGFAVAVNVEPDILIVDESLSVGDALFKAMCLQKMRELRDRGTTILFVSHSTGLVKDFCSEAILLHEGRMVAQGDVAETADHYQALLANAQAKRGRNLLGSDGKPVDYQMDNEEGESFAEPEFKENPDLERRARRLRHGTGEARISNVEILDEEESPIKEVSPDSTITIRAHLEYRESVENSVLGITLRNKAGLDVFSTNTNLEKQRLGRRRKGERVVVDFTLGVPLKHGPYSVTAFVSYAANQPLYMDWVDVAAVFEIARPEGRGPIPGLFHIPTDVEIHSLDRERPGR